MRFFTLSAVLVLATLAGSAARAFAQAAATVIPTQCTSRERPAVPAAAQRRAARDMAARAQEAAITDDAARARELYQRAAQLDPSDPAIAYALGRAYETAHDPRASAEYCRFLALTPEAPEAQDVRARLATVAALSLAASPPASPRVVAAPAAPANPGGAFATGMILPGGGQYATHRPAAGLFVTAVTGGALYFALQSQTVHDSVAHTATDPNGKQYQFYTPRVRTDRSHLAPGLAAAAAINLIAAIEAYSYARGEQRHASQARLSGAGGSAAPMVTPIVADINGGLALGVRLAVGH